MNKFIERFSVFEKRIKGKDALPLEKIESMVERYEKACNNIEAYDRKYGDVSSRMHCDLVDDKIKANKDLEDIGYWEFVRLYEDEIRSVDTHPLPPTKEATNE